jgi:hypothetical protein
MQRNKPSPSATVNNGEEAPHPLTQEQVRVDVDVHEVVNLADSPLGASQSNENAMDDALDYTPIPRRNDSTGTLGLSGLHLSPRTSRRSPKALNFENSMFPSGSRNLSPELLSQTMSEDEEEEGAERGPNISNKRA